MKICYKCFHTSEDGAHFCENCGFPLDYENQSAYADALPCGTTLYGRYLIGQVLQQNDSSITYIAQDSRTKGTVAVRELFTKKYCVRTPMRSVSIPEENREQFQDVFQEEKDLFLQTAEDLFDEFEEDSVQLPCVQSYFSQNSTAYMVIDYGSQEKLQAFLDGKILTAEALRARAEAAKHQTAKPAAGSVIEPAADLSAIPAAGPIIEPAADLSADQAASAASIRSAEPNPAEMPAADLSADQAVPSASIRSAEPNPAEMPAADLSADQAVPSASIRGGSGSGKNNFLPAAIILGMLAVLLIILFILLPRAIAGFGGMGEGVRSIFEQYRTKYTEFLEKQKKDLDIENPFKQIEDIFNDEPVDEDVRDDEPGDEEVEDDELGDEDIWGDEFEDIDDKNSITSGNFYNRGYYVLYDDEYYFSDATGFYKFSDENPDDPEKISNARASYLNVYEDNIYYLDKNAGKIICYEPYFEGTYELYDSDGEEEFAPQSLCIYDGWCYFSNENKLYRFDMEDAESLTIVQPDDVDLCVSDYNMPGWVNTSLCFAGDYLIYNGTEGITALDLDSFPDKKVISDQQGNLISNGKDIFCWFGTHRIYRIGLDGKTEEIVSTESDDMITSFNCRDSRVYFTVKSDESTEIRSVSDDGTNVKTVGMTGLDGATVFSFCVFPESKNAYFYLLLNNDGKINSTHDIVSLK